MSDALRRKREQRFQFLGKLYEVTDGNPLRPWVDVEVGQLLGFDKPLVDMITDYLQEEGLIECTMGGGVMISHRGVVEVEEALLHPSEPTYHFPAIQNIVNITNSTVTGANIAQGGSRVAMADSNQGGNVGTVRDLLAALKVDVSTSKLPEPTKVDLVADIDAADAHLRKSTPNIPLGLEAIKAVLELGKAAVESPQVQAGLMALANYVTQSGWL